MTSPANDIPAAAYACSFGCAQEHGVRGLEFLWAAKVTIVPPQPVRVLLILDQFGAQPSRPERAIELLQRLLRLGVHSDSPVRIHRLGDPRPLIPVNALSEWEHPANLADAFRARELEKPSSTFAGLVGPVLETAGHEAGSGEMLAFLIGDGDFVDPSPWNLPGWRWFWLAESSDRRPSKRLARVIHDAAPFAASDLANSRFSNPLLAPCRIDVQPRAASMALRNGAQGLSQWIAIGSASHDFRRGELTVFGRGASDPREAVIRIEAPSGTAVLRLSTATPSTTLASEASSALQTRSTILSMRDAMLLAESDSKEFRRLLAGPTMDRATSLFEFAVVRQAFEFGEVQAALVISAADRTRLVLLRGTCDRWSVEMGQEAEFSTSRPVSFHRSGSGWFAEWGDAEFRQDVGYYAATRLKRPIFAQDEKDLPVYFIPRPPELPR